MSIKRTLIKNSSYNLASYVYLAIASLISIPIVLRNLGSDLYGSYILFNGIVLVAATFDLGLSQATIRWLSLPDISESDKKTTWKTSLYFFYLLGLTLSAINLLVFSLLLRKLPAFSILPIQDYYLAALISSGIVLVNHLNIAFLTIPQAHQRFDIYNTRTIIVGTANTLLTAWLATRYPNLPSLLALQLIFHTLALITLINYSREELGVNPLTPKFDRPTAHKLLSFGYKNFITNIANQTRVQFSNFTLGGLIGASAVTAFSIPQNIIIKAAGGISQITLVFFPLSTSLISKDRFPKLIKLIIQLELIIFLLGILQVFLINKYGYHILSLWLGNPEVVSLAFPVLKVLSWFFLLTTLTPIPTSVFESLNLPHIPAITASLNTVLTIGIIFYLNARTSIANPALIPAYATLIASLILVPIFLLMLAKVIRKHQHSLNGK